MAFRFDDPSAYSDHALERRIIACFAAQAMPVTVAVIPFEAAGARPPVEPSEAMAHLIQGRRDNLVHIAQHGYAHRSRLAAASGARSEFAGAAYAEQRRMISEGQRHLAGIFGCPISGFVPPWNRCDSATVSVLAELGFDYLSSGFEPPYPSFSGPAIIPRTCTLPNVKAAVAEARRYAALEPLVVVILHHFDFAESGEAAGTFALHDLDALLAWLKSQPDVRLTTLSAIARERRNDLVWASLYHRLKRRLRNRLGARIPSLCLLANPLWQVAYHWSRTALERVFSP